MLITGRTDQQELRAQTALLDRIIMRYQRAIAREIARAMNEAANKYPAPMWDIEVEQKHVENMSTILFNLWTQAGRQSADRLFNVAKSLGYLETKADPDNEDFDLSADAVTRAISEWIFIWGGTDITEVTRTTMLNINNVIAAGVFDGLSERAIGRLVASVAPTKSASRAQTIARTESHRAANGVSLSVAQQTGIPMLKKWITNIDSRTRDGDDSRFNHVEANGQLQPINGKFLVSGERLDYAGDPRGSAGNVINCRCVIGYEIDRGQAIG